MRQFEEVLAQHPHCPMRTADVCKAIGVSANTLRACCLSSLGMAPGQYDRLKRLNLARAAFWRSDGSAAALPEFARRYGFYRSSRFSDLYRSVFGEPPMVKSKHAQ
jgi:transcriptional regulator GlxA family with amidase domain